MSANSRAVFLSYASQDAETARRICESLRQAGVEVWFDQSELRGGDAWDQKIRKQIKECALFVPIISANTEARLEGYFRLEWRLADQRSHLMAKGKPFLLPVVIDETRDADAHVPDSFVDVQWTRLSSSETPPAFCERVASLLAAEPGEAGRHRSASAEKHDEGVTSKGKRGSRMWPAAAVVAVVALGLSVLWWSGPARPGPVSGASATTTEAVKLAEQARLHYAKISSRESLALAEEFGRRATDADPQLARAWAVRAGANAAYLLRGFVHGEAARQRARDAEAFANRALTLDQNDLEALVALGLVADAQGAANQAEGYYRRVLALDPGNLFASRFLSIVLRRTNRVPEAIALMQGAAQRAPRDALTRLDLGLTYLRGWNFARAWDEFEATHAEQPFAGALVRQAWLALQWKGDVAQMRGLLDRVDLTNRGDHETVYADLLCGLFERRPDAVLEAAGRTATDFIEDYMMPKAMLVAHAHELARRENLARQQWQAAEATVRARLRSDPQHPILRARLATILAQQGRVEDARADLVAVEATWQEQMTPGRAEILALFYSGSREAAKAVAWLRQSVHRGSSLNPMTLHQLRLDPRWDAIRASPEFQALLADPPPLPVPVEGLRTAQP